MKRSTQLVLIGTLLIVLISNSNSQSDWKYLREGIEYSDSLDMYLNHCLEIELHQRSCDQANEWLGCDTTRSDWKRTVFRNLYLELTHPKFCLPKLHIAKRDTTISIYIKAKYSRLDQIKSNKLIDAIDIIFTNKSFDEIAADYGFVVRDNIWYVDGVMLNEAVFIEGKNWRALDGGNLYRESLEGGGTGLAEEEIFFAYKQLAPNRGFVFEKSDDVSNEDFVGIITSLQYYQR